MLSLLAVGAACVAFVRWGIGAFRPLDFVVDVGALHRARRSSFTAALAVLFDVTPVLRGRAGLVIWFFVFAVARERFQRARRQDGRVVSLPRVDPLGMASLEGQVAQSLPEATAISSGLIFHDKPFMRVDVARAATVTAPTPSASASSPFSPRCFRSAPRCSSSTASTRRAAGAAGRGEKPWTVAASEAPAPVAPLRWPSREASRSTHPLFGRS